MLGPLLWLNNYAVFMGSHALIQSATLAMEKTGCTCISGPSGAGKSTLIQALCGLYESSANIVVTGEARFLGEPLGVTGRPVMPVATPRLHLSSLLENMLPEPYAGNNGKDREQTDWATRKLIKNGFSRYAVNLSDPIRSLPLVVQRFAAVVRLAEQDSPLLCLNEPFSGLNSEETGKIQSLISSIAESKAVLVAVTGASAESVPSDWRVLELVDGVVLDERFVKEALPADLPIPPSVEPECEPEVEEIPYCDNFQWVFDYRLAGCLVTLDHSLPDIVHRIVAQGAENILLLCERFPEDQLAAGTEIHCSLFSMPEINQLPTELLSALCQKIEDLIRERGSVVVCGEPGSGKIAALLGAFLIWEGMSAHDAWNKLTDLDPAWLSGDEVDWLEVRELLESFSWN